MSKPSAQSVLIIGAASDIALAIARRFAQAGAALILAARSVERLATDAQDMRLRFSVDVRLVGFDMIAFDQHTAFLDAVGTLPDVVICVVGLLGEQAVAASDPQAAKAIMDTNYVMPALLFGEIANRMEARGSGVLVGISSVAGDRGRASNYVYGAAKAGWTAFLSGLRARLSRTPVRVVTIKPGFVATQMTAGMKLPPALTAQPVEVGEAVYQAAEKGADVVYVRGIWRLIMTIIALVPEAVFKKLRF